jgi:hypothetical protein
MAGENIIQVVPEEWLPQTSIHANQGVRDLGRRVSSLPFKDSGVTAFSEDEAMTGSAYLQSFGGKHFLVGQVVFTHPGAYWYRVRLDVGGGEIGCCVLSQNPFRPLGVRNCQQIPAASRVLVYISKGMPFGIIMGCLPLIKDGAPSYSDFIVQGSGVGGFRESYYTSIPNKFANNGGVINFSCHRPSDSLGVGEWGQFNDLGGGFFIDPMMLFMRMDECSGLWMFYMDRLTRLCGYNFDFRSVISEETIRNDDGEGLHYSGYTPYPWEAAGAMNHSVEYFDDSLDDKDVITKSLRAKIEPKEKDQQPFYRLEEYRGYLGQAYMRSVQVPTDLSGINRYSSDPGLGVFREQLGLNGSWGVFSAHSIHIAKRTFLPHPKRIKPPEDATGDDLAKKSGYSPAGIYQSGDSFQDHKLTDARGSDHAAWGPAALLDALAYTTNWMGYHPFHYHAKDFARVEEDIQVQESIDFSLLKKNQWLPLPEPEEVEIDHRLKAKFYALLSCLSFLPDGGVVIRGGAGCEIRLAGGSAQISAPGDIITQTGRSAITYAGDDCVIKAHNSVDLSAANGDMRLKSDVNMDLMSGNSGSGRLLVECRSEGGSNDVVGKFGEDIEQDGVIIKSSGNAALIASNGLYARTISGQVTIDAASGQNAIRTISSNITHFTQLVTMAFSAGNVQSVHVFGATAVEFGGGIVGKGPMILTDGGIECKGSVAAIDGQAGGVDFSNPGYGLAQAQLSNLREEFRNRSNKASEEFENSITNTWYGDGGLGSEEVINNTQFAPRTAKQMNSDDFTLPEVYWQQITTGGDIWNEPTITYQGQEMMPHPGLVAWQTESGFLKTPLQLHNVSTGEDKAPGSAYENYEPQDFEASKMSENYKIIGV